jgi:hypothetical protein
MDMKAMELAAAREDGCCDIAIALIVNVYQTSPFQQVGAPP